MQNDQEKLRIHTAMRPETAEKEEKCASDTEERTEQERRPSYISARGNGRRRKIHRRRSEGERLTRGEKLIRNAAVSCALFLSVMAVKNIDQPWSRQATEGVRAAMTMSVDWDETLGRLSFVRALVPDTALVFLNLGGGDLRAPVSGRIHHEYTEQQPWLEYRCDGAQPVVAAMEGVVSAVGQGAGGDRSVLLTDEKGNEAVYGYLGAVYVEVGQAVEAGQQIASTAEGAESRLYFEWRENGASADPGGRLDG